MIRDTEIPLTESEYERVLELAGQAKERIRKLSDDGYLEDIPHEKTPYIFQTKATKSFELAIYTFADSKHGRVRDYFVSAAQSFITGKEEYLSTDGVELGGLDGIPADLLKALYASLLARDASTMQRVLDNIYALPRAVEIPWEDIDETQTLPPTRYYLTQLVASLVSGDDGRAQIHLSNLESAASEKEGTYRDRLDAVSTFARGIINDEPELIRDGLEARLAAHESIVRTDDGRLTDIIMCVEATALVEIARRRGYDMDIESDFIAEELTQ